MSSARLPAIALAFNLSCLLVSIAAYLFPLRPRGEMLALSAVMALPMLGLNLGAALFCRSCQARCVFALFTALSVGVMGVGISAALRLASGPGF